MAAVATQKKRLAGEVVELFASTQEPDTSTEDTQVIDPQPLSPEPEETIATPATPQPTPLRPVPERELTPEGRRIRDLEDRLAKELGKKDPAPVFETADTAKDNIVIHFLEDGFTALGHVWFRGQELEFNRNSGAYADTCDRYGRSWLDLVDDEFGQAERWGKVMFRRGPWPGKSYADAAATARFEKLKSIQGDGYVTAPTEDDLAAVDVAERKRARAVPRISA